jgi:dethiobiotin synthetase
MISGVFITGTDTAVGKTYFSALLVRALRSRGLDAVGIKPFCCGDRSDADLLHEASQKTISLDEVNPVWLRVPAAPYAASLVENRLLDTETAFEGVQSVAVKHDYIVVEGVGGWRVPLTQHLCMSGFAKALGLPVVVVSANRMGTINHTQLTVDAIIASKARCLGVVLNRPTPEAEDPATITNRAVLENLLSVSILGELDHGLAEMPDSTLERIFPATK